MNPGPLWNTEQHGQFVDRLKGSSEAVFAVAYHHLRRGRTVEIPPLSISPGASENIAHTDGGDLFVTTLKGTRYRIEIKHRKRPFTSLIDWPDPHIFVSNVGAVERAAGEVHAYIIVNLPLTHAAVISQSSKGHWYVIERKPSNTDVAEKVYCCPRELVGFIRLDGR